MGPNKISHWYLPKPTFLPPIPPSKLIKYSKRYCFFLAFFSVGGGIHGAYHQSSKSIRKEKYSQLPHSIVSGFFKSAASNATLFVLFPLNLVTVARQSVLKEKKDDPFS